MSTPTHHDDAQTTTGGTTRDTTGGTVIDLTDDAVTLDTIEAELFELTPDTLEPQAREDVTAAAVIALTAAVQAIPGVTFWSPRTRRLGVAPGHAAAVVRDAVVAFVVTPPADLVPSCAVRVVGVAA